MNTKRTYISLAITACLIAAVLGTASVVRRPYSGSSGTAAADNGGNPVVAIATSTAPVSELPKAKYRNGTYTAVGNYDSPAGRESIGVSLTLKNGVVSASTVTQMAHDETSSYYQQRFISGYMPLVVGKSIDSIRLDAVSGSSLTPIGFNAALAKIKAQAQQS